MSTQVSTFQALSDQDLLREVTRLAAGERDATTRLIASLVELDRRRLYLAEGFSSLFGYCTDVLRLSEHAAYDRITAARATQRFPVILERLADGSVTLTTVRLLAPHLTDENHAALLAEACHRSKRDLEHIVARLHPQPDVPSSVRKLPATPPPNSAPSMAAPNAPADEAQASATPAAASPPVDQSQAAPAPSPVCLTSPPQPAVVVPLAPARYKVSFTVDAETYAKLRQVQDLLRHVVPDGDPAVIYDRALTALLTQLTKTKGNAVEPSEAGAARQACNEAERASSRACTPTPRSRHIPADVQRAVWQRDGGQCTFVSRSGRRCAARSCLEFHHTVPFAMGGEASLGNIRLMCRAHNAYQAKRDFPSRDTLFVRETAPAYGGSQLVPARVPAGAPPEPQREKIRGREPIVDSARRVQRGSRWVATPRMTSATAATSAGDGICFRTTMPMTAAVAGKRERSKRRWRVAVAPSRAGRRRTGSPMRRFPRRYRLRAAPGAPARVAASRIPIGTATTIAMSIARPSLSIPFAPPAAAMR